MMTDGYTFNRVNFTPNEESCILKFLNEARECGYPSGNSIWYDTIDKIANEIFPREWKEITSIPVYS